MAIYECTECSKPVSELANECPHCGAWGSGPRSKEYARARAEAEAKAAAKSRSRWFKFLLALAIGGYIFAQL